jgi:hypothetical protein
MARETIGKALRLGFLVGHHQYGHPSFGTLAIQWGKTTFHSDTPLYCDWEFLIRKSGGLNSLGVGFVGLGVSAGWSSSLWSSFQEKVSGASAEIDRLCDGDEATISGYVTFSDTISEDGPTDVNNVVFMEGVDWIPGIVTDAALDSAPDLEGVRWCLCYFRKDSFMYPASIWGNIQVPVRIYGEIVETPITTQLGRAECFMKARAGAYLCPK